MLTWHERLRASDCFRARFVDSRYSVDESGEEGGEVGTVALPKRVPSQTLEATCHLSDGCARWMPAPKYRNFGFEYILSCTEIVDRG